MFEHTYCNTRNTNHVDARAAARARIEIYFTPKTESVVRLWRRATGGKVYKPVGVPAGVPVVPISDFTS